MILDEIAKFGILTQVNAVKKVAVHPNPTPTPTSSNYPCSMTSYFWFAGDVTAAVLVVKNKLKHFSPLGAKQNKNK